MNTWIRLDKCPLLFFLILIIHKRYSDKDLIERMRQINKLFIILFILFLFGTQACVTSSKKDSLEWFKIGTASLKSGSYNEAATALDNAIDLDPQYAEAYYQRGLVYGFTGDDDEAIDKIKIAARLDFKLAQDFLRKKRIEW